MFEKRLKEISDKFHSEKRKFFILTYKKNKREIYFQNKRKAIEFMERKFGSWKKEIIFFLIKLGLLQPFLKKIYLPSELGDIILVGGQVKGFDLEKKNVLSFIKKEVRRDSFIKSKKFQIKISKRGFAPKIIKFDSSFPYSKEELLRQNRGNGYKRIFRRLLKFYDFSGIEKVPVRKYVEKLKRNLEKKDIKNNFLYERLNEISEKNVTILRTLLHGDFAREQILIKDNSYVFTDWEPYQGIIIGDLVNFFNTEEIVSGKSILKNKKFRELLSIYPSIVKNNIRTYLFLNEMESILKSKGDISVSRKRVYYLLKNAFYK